MIAFYIALEHAVWLAGLTLLLVLVVAARRAGPEKAAALRVWIVGLLLVGGVLYVFDRQRASALPYLGALAAVGLLLWLCGGRLKFAVLLWLKGRVRIDSPVLGALNLAGDAGRDLLATDLDAIGRGFAPAKPNDGAVPRCDVLLLYGNLRANGRFEGTELSLRQVIQEAGAAIVIVASEHPGELLVEATRDPVFGRASLVLTIDRRGENFGAFFARLFDRMRSGVAMPAAWTSLCPQVEGLDHPDAPATLFLAENGVVSFVRQS